VEACSGDYSRKLWDTSASATQYSVSTSNGVSFTKGGPRLLDGPENLEQLLESPMVTTKDERNTSTLPLVAAILACVVLCLYCERLYSVSKYRLPVKGCRSLTAHSNTDSRSRQVAVFLFLSFFSFYRFPSLPN
jgi:hypothetical protein